MEFYNDRFYWAYDVEHGEIKGHWILAFSGPRAAIEEVHAYVLTAKKDFYHHDYPDFVRDFEESKQFFVKKDGKWTPCKWEDCKESDEVLLRANSLRPCDIEELEDQNLFFDLWDDIPIPQNLTEAYCIWPENPKLNGYACILHSYSIGDRCDFSVVLDRKTDRIPPLFVDFATFSHDEREKTFVCGDPPFDWELEEMLGVEWAE